MPSIAILAPDVADQIAAGEVVERPASVVKELLENAFDAGARSVEISVEEGGRKLIRVSDDGTGMDREDALLALERHGTSKIRLAADLVTVGSLGFRGEALPSIASVADLEIETAIGDRTGTRVRTTPGRARDVADAVRRRGTTVAVARLFHNVPARLKFLRSARSEWRAITDSITAAALARRDIRISVAHDGRSVMDLPEARDLTARVAGLWGARYAERFIPADAVTGPIHVSGLVERPSEVGTATRRMFLIVNRRPIRDAGLVRAAESAYRSTIPAGVRPSLLLEIVLPPDAVDVNVHPAKAEVRFRDRWSVERAVEAAVRRALGPITSAAGIGSSQFAGDWASRQWTPRHAPTDGSQSFSGAAAFEATPSYLDQDIAAAAGAVATLAPPAADFVAGVEGGPRIIQLRRTYLMLEHEDGIVLIDQHAAHERVLCEQFTRAFERGDAPSQRLLLPLTLHLGPAEAEALEANRSELERLGFEIEAFGGDSILIHSVPAPHPRFDAERCLRETLDALTGDRAPGAAARHQRLLATVACKAAVKAGDALSEKEMHALVWALRNAELPAHDVHGRSAIVHLSWAELERRFGRR